MSETKKSKLCFTIRNYCLNCFTFNFRLWQLFSSLEDEEQVDKCFIVHKVRIYSVITLYSFIWKFCLRSARRTICYYYRWIRHISLDYCTLPSNSGGSRWVRILPSLINCIHKLFTFLWWLYKSGGCQIDSFNAVEVGSGFKICLIWSWKLAIEM